jgi:hypothetical protein
MVAKLPSFVAGICLAAWVGVSCVQSTQTGCGLSDSAWAVLRNHIAWEAYWVGNDYFGSKDSLQVEYATDGERAFWSLPFDRFIPPARLVVSYSPNSGIGASSCSVDPWSQCILSPPTQEPHALQEMGEGRPRPPAAKSVALSGICRAELVRSDIAPWRPTSPNPAKESLVAKIEAALLEHAAINPLNDAVMNDFNVLDLCNLHCGRHGCCWKPHTDVS